MLRSVLSLTVALTMAGWSCPLTAQTVVISELGYIFPPGYHGGAAVDLRLGLYDPTDDLQFFLLDDSEEAKLTLHGPAGRLLMQGVPYLSGPKGYRPLPMPRERPARLQLPAVSKNRMLRIQIANANGAGQIHRFLISPDRAIHEDPENSTSSQALPALPTAVLGCLTQHEEVDRYSFQADLTGPVTARLMARQLGAPFHGALEAHDQQGQLLTDTADTTGIDPSIAFFVQQGEFYTVSVRDLDFRGHRSFVYRLSLRAEPHIITTNPVVGRRGAQLPVRFIGYGLQTRSMKLETVVETITFPHDPQVTDFQAPLTTEFGKTSYSIRLDNIPQRSYPDRPANKAPEPVHADTGITRTFGANVDEHVYILDAKADEFWTVRATARAVGSPVDLALVIRDANGETIAENDDLPRTTDPAIHFQASTAGPFQVSVRNLSGQSGATAFYYLELRQAAPGFRLQLESQQVQLPVGETAELVLRAQRSGGFNGTIRIEAKGVPEGVTIQPGNPFEIPAGKNMLKVTFACRPDSSSQAALLSFTGSAQLDGVQVRHPAWAPDNSNLAAREPEFTSAIMLVRTLKPRIKIKPEESDERTVHRGSTHLGGVLFERLEGYDGEVLVTLSGSQETKFRQGFGGPDVRLEADALHLFYPCFLPEWLETLDAYRGRLNAVASVRDGQGFGRQLITRFPPNTSFGITIEGALLRLSHQSQELTVPRGASFDLPIRISRSPKLTVPIQLQLIVPAVLKDLVFTNPETLPTGKSNVYYKIQSLDKPALNGRHRLTVRALASQRSALFPTIVDAGVSPLDPGLIELMKQGQMPVMSETHFLVHFVGDTGPAIEKRPERHSILPKDL